MHTHTKLWKYKHQAAYTMPCRACTLTDGLLLFEDCKVFICTIFPGTHRRVSMKHHPESSGTPRKPAVSGIIDSIHLVSITLCYFQILIAAPFPSPGDLMDLNFFHIKYLLQETLRICRDWEAMTLQCRCSITGSNDLSQGEEAALSPGGNRNSCSEPIGGGALGTGCLQPR